MTAARHRQPKRTGLRAAGSPLRANFGLVLACRCPTKIVAGTIWAYDARLGWHDPAEHDTWTPPGRAARVPLPPALLLDEAGTRPSRSTLFPACDADRLGTTHTDEYGLTYHLRPGRRPGLLLGAARPGPAARPAAGVTPAPPPPPGPPRRPGTAGLWTAVLPAKPWPMDPAGFHRAPRRPKSGRSLRLRWRRSSGLH